ncbi:hypothetical protein PM082_014210 [Marasmius tenuissimus]|nr:hypothetical protein PM082_014210 [Marasmius tenuissimus]
MTGVLRAFQVGHAQLSLPQQRSPASSIPKPLTACVASQPDKRSPRLRQQDGEGQTKRFVGVTTLKTPWMPRSTSSTR